MSTSNRNVQTRVKVNGGTFKKRPKVIHLTAVHNSEDNRILHKECVSLSKAGFEVTLIAAGATQRSFEGVCIRSVRMAGNRLARMIMTSYFVWRLAREQNANIYHLHDPELLPWGQILRCGGARVIFDMHENLPAALLTKQWLPSGVRRLLSLLLGASERLLLRGMPIVFAENSYQKFYPWVRHAVTVLNFPDVEKVPDATRCKFGEFTAGYMGSVTALRGSVVSIEAVARLNDTGTLCGLHFVGPCTERHRVDLECRLQKRDRLRTKLHGWQSLDVGWSIMAQCHVGLALLQEVPNYVESYPTKLFEYMALGLPVVVSHFPIYREVVERHSCGLCVDPSSSVAVADALRYLADNPSEAEAMGQRGRKAVRERFSWSQEADKLIAFYGELSEDG